MSASTLMHRTSVTEKTSARIPGPALKRAISGAGKTQAALADEIGVSAQTISRWVSEGFKATNDKWPYLEAALGVDLSELLVDIIEVEKSELRSIRELVERALSERGQAPRQLPHAMLTQLPAGVGTGFMFEGLQAGLGEELVESDHGYHCAELQSLGELAFARVAGRSMEPTLHAGDIAVCVMYPRPVVLEPIVGNAGVPWARFMSEVPEGTICIAQVNDDAPTCKRITYRSPDQSSSGRWVVSLTADNQEWGETRGYPYFVSKDDTLRLYARVVAIGEMRP